MVNFKEVKQDRDTWRLIPSHYPPIRLFEDLVDPDELELAYLLEGLTNDRLRDQAGDISLVMPEDRVVGPGTTPIMAAFTHIGFPSRFTNGSFGVYYAGFSERTAIVEALFSNQRRLEDSQEGEQMVTLRCYKARTCAPLLDIRGTEKFMKDDWAACQVFGAKARASGRYGLIYSSVRFEGGECLAAFRPTAMLPAIQTKTLMAHWNGQEFSQVDELKPVVLV